MSRGLFGRLISILLTFAITVGVVAVLSAVSDNSGMGGYTRQVQEEAVQEFSAPAAGEQGISFAAGLSGFVGLMAVPLAAFLVFAKRMRRGQQTRRQNQSYAPKKDMSMGKLMKS